MSKNTNLSFLTDYITADITNGRIGINNDSPAYAFDVTGIARTSTSTYLATASGNVGIGTTSPSNKLHIISSSTSTAGLLVTGGSSIQGDATSGQILLGNTTANQGSISYGNLTGYVYIDNSWANNDGDIRFRTKTSGTALDALTIKGSGNVGIGTATIPTAISGFDALILGKSTSSSSALVFTNGGSTAWGFSYANVSKITLSSYADLTLETGASATERMRILANGSVCIGMTTSPYGRVSIKSNSATIYAGFGIYAASNENFTLLNHDGNVGYIGCDSTATGFATPLAFWINSAIRMTMSTNGSIGAPSGTNIYNASDARLKKNISTTTYGLDAISALNPVKFNWVDGFEPSEDGKDMLGFVAQEVQQIIPEAIESFGGNSITIGDTTIDNPLRVNEKFIIPVLVKAIQELKAEIETLKNK
jgi:hypothetical protein